LPASAARLVGIRFLEPAVAMLATGRREELCSVHGEDDFVAAVEKADEALVYQDSRTIRQHGEDKIIIRESCPP
jgi:hypothetical protein